MTDFPIDKITKITLLPLEEIEKLKSELKEQGELK